MASNNGSGERRPATARRSPGMQRPSSQSQSASRQVRATDRPAGRRSGEYYDDMQEAPRRRRPAPDSDMQARYTTGEIRMRQPQGSGGDYPPTGQRRQVQQRDPRMSGEERPRRPVREGSPQRPARDGSSQRPVREGASQRPVREGATQRPARDGATQRSVREGAPSRAQRETKEGASPRPQREPSNKRVAPPVSIEAKKPVSRKEKAKKKSKKTMILFFIEVVIIMVLLGFIYFVRQTSRVEKIRINEEAITIEMNQTVTTNETMKGYRNIAMFGVDSREGTLGKGTRSDTIIIASINQDTGDVKLLSVFRDTYLNLGNDTYNKCNAAYAQGGPEQAVIMLNKNLDMDITDYITVGFDGLIEVIDALGGVEIDVTDAEISHLNNYQISMVGTTTDGINFKANAGTDYTPVTSPGRQKLNGLQATAYCRIRYIGNDFQRAQRQRDVISAIALEAKKASVSQLNNVVTGVMDNVSTSLDVSEILEVASDLTKYNIVGNDGFPFEENRDTGRVGAKGDCVIPIDLKANVVEAHKFFFGEEDYQVSPEVESYSEKVASDTGKRK